MKQYQYYPGCSIRGTAGAYEESLFAVMKALDVELDEIRDWNCCGATAYMSVDEIEALALAGRNLAIAEKDGGRDLVAPCAACYLVLNKTQKQLAESVTIRGKVTRAMKAAGLEYKGTVKIRHPLDILVNDVSLEAIKDKVTRPLKGLKVAPYYGCQVVRPYALFDSQHDPQTMDQILKALGTTVVDYPYKTRCCGGSQTGTLPEVGLHLVHMLLEEAKDREADVIATLCPLCQFNLDAYQDRVENKYGLKPIPIVYFTQLMGKAFGIDAKKLGLQRGIVPAEATIERKVSNAA